MNSTLRGVGAWALILFVLAGAPATGAASASFDQFVDEFLDGYYAFRPVLASRAGRHEHDARLSGFSRADITAETDRLQAALERCATFQNASLDSASRCDLEILTPRIRAEILDLETIRRWQRDPSWYSAMIVEGIHGLVRDPGPITPARVEALCERQSRFGAVLSAALENLSNPHRFATEAAIAQLNGGIELLKTELPRRVSVEADTALQRRFTETNRRAVLELESFSRYLAEDLLPASRGEFSIGLRALESWIQFNEHCDVPIFRLERFGEMELDRLGRALEATVAAIDANRKPQDLLRVLSIDYAEDERLMKQAAARSDDLRDFCGGLVTIPDGFSISIGSTPLHLDRSGLTLLDLPGHRNDGASAVVYLTGPGPGIRSLARDDYMRNLNRFALPFALANEGLPGRSLQAWHNRRSPSRVIAAFGSESLSRGWGAYVETMLVDEGFAGGDLQHRLFQQRRALVDACRFQAAIRLHSAAMSFDDAVSMFMTNAFVDRATAEREARRAALDPGVLSSLLGKLQILKMRQDYERTVSGARDLRLFHDRLLSYGSAPPRVIRRALMPGDKGSVL